MSSAQTLEDSVAAETIISLKPSIVRYIVILANEEPSIHFVSPALLMLNHDHLV